MILKNALNFIEEDTDQKKCFIFPQKCLFLFIYWISLKLPVSEICSIHS